MAYFLKTPTASFMFWNFLIKGWQNFNSQTCPSGQRRFEDEDEDREMRQSRFEVPEQQPLCQSFMNSFPPFMHT